MAYVFHLPLPPSVNQLYLNVRGRGRVKTKHYKTWKKAAGWELRAQMGMARLNLTGPIRVTIIAAKPDNRKRDLDNISKALLDLLVEHCVIADDSKVEKLLMEWTSDNLTGVSVTVEQIEVKHGAYDTRAVDPGTPAMVEGGQGASQGALHGGAAKTPATDKGRKNRGAVDPVRTGGSRVGEIEKLQRDLSCGTMGSRPDSIRVGRKLPSE